MNPLRLFKLQLSFNFQDCKFFFSNEELIVQNGIHHVIAIEDRPSPAPANKTGYALVLRYRYSISAIVVMLDIAVQRFHGVV